MNTAPIVSDGSAELMRLTPVGDINQDGRDDLVRWTPHVSGAVVRSGLMPMVEMSIVRADSAELISVAGVGDVDNDGRDDIATTWQIGANLPFVVVYHVPSGALPGAALTELLSASTTRDEPNFGLALGTAY